MNMPTPAVAPAQNIPPLLPEQVAPFPPRRFELPDLDRHGFWLLPRLRKMYPHLNDRAVISWLRSILYVAEFKVLYTPNSMSLAQMESAHTLSAKPVVREHFTLVKDPEDKAQQEEASAIYDELARWAKHVSADVILISPQTDVPQELISKRIGRLFKTEQYFARV